MIVHFLLNNYIDLMANISQNRYQFPTVEDFSGAVAAIIRLQDTYNLEPSTIAKGKLSSKGLSMTSKYVKSDV